MITKREKIKRLKVLLLAAGLVIGLIGAYLLYASIVPSGVQGNSAGISAGNVYMGNEPDGSNLRNLAEIDSDKAQLGIWLAAIALILQTSVAVIEVWSAPVEA